MKRISKNLIFFSVIFVFFFLFGGRKIFQVLSDTKKDYQYLSLVSEISALIKTRYVETVDPVLKFPGAFSSMLSSLDRFSAYLNPKKSKIYSLYQDGLVFSLGIHGKKYQNYFYITDVITNSPAQKAGLEYGDIIQAINGKSLTGFSFWEIFLSLLSEKSENIKLVIKKKNSNKISKVTLQTEKLFTSPTLKKISDNVYLINLFRVDINAVQFLKETMKKYPDSRWIFDLRRYSGGDFLSFLDLTKLLIQKQNSLYLKTKKGIEKYLVGSNQSGHFKGLFIIGPSTFMYLELLALLLKVDNKTLIGSKTPGFMPHLKQFYLPDKSSILLTYGFFRYHNKELPESGIEPQIEMKEIKSDTLIKYCLELLKNNK